MVCATRRQSLRSGKTRENDAGAMQSDVNDEQEEQSTVCVNGTAARKTVENASPIRPSRRRKSIVKAVVVSDTESTTDEPAEFIKVEVDDNENAVSPSRRRKSVTWAEAAFDLNSSTAQPAEVIKLETVDNVKPRRGRKSVIKTEDSSAVISTTSQTMESIKGNKSSAGPSRKRKSGIKPDPFDTDSTTEQAGDNIKLQIGTAFLGKWIINKLLVENDLERIYSVSPMSNPNENAVLRCVPVSQNIGILLEASFLTKMSTRSVGHMFADLSGIDEIEVTDKNISFAYIITSLRASAEISDICKDFPCQNQRLNTCSTIFADILNIIEVTCRFGYVLNNMILDDFSYDIVSRRVFLSNRRHVSIGWERLGVPALFPGKKQVSWTGTLDYAPYSYHLRKDSPVTEADCVESMFYLYLDLMGLLPWSTNKGIMVATKKQWWSSAKLNLRGPCPENVSIALSRFWREYCRGSRVDVNRDSSLKNGELSLRRPFPLFKAGQKERVLPRACMLNYTLLHDELLYIARSALGSRGELNKEIFVNTEKADVILEGLRLRNSINYLQLQLNGLEMESAYRLRHQAEMDFHQGKNAIIIERHVAGHGTLLVDVKDEPLEDDSFYRQGFYDPEDSE